MNGSATDLLDRAKVTAAGAGVSAAAGVMIYVLAQAWVDSTQQDVRIAIEQAGSHGKSLDRVHTALIELIERIGKLEARLAAVEQFAAAGNRYTLERGVRLEERVSDLEAYHRQKLPVPEATTR